MNNRLGLPPYVYAIVVGIVSGATIAARVAVLGFAICGFGVLADIAVWPDWMSLGVIAAIAAGVGLLAAAYDTTVEVLDVRHGSAAQ